MDGISSEIPDCIKKVCTVSPNVQNISDKEVQCIEQIQLSSPKKRRGRPRKTADNSTNRNIAHNITINNSILENTVNTEYMTRRKRYTRKITIATSELDDVNDDSNVEDEFGIKKRGRPVGSRGRRRGGSRGRGRGVLQRSLDKEYVPSFKQKNSFTLRETEDKKLDLEDTKPNLEISIENDKTSLNASNIEKNIELVTCAKCQEQIQKRQWSTHNLYRHNNMAWRENEEPLNFENNDKMLKKVLASALKTKKKRTSQRTYSYLTCEKCGIAKRSVVGFISHMQFCGKSEAEKQALMMTCSTCQAVMMPSSMEIHERSHKHLEKNKDKETIHTEMPIIQTERVKRKAAERAVPKIMELNKYANEELSLKKIRRDSFIAKQQTERRIPSIWKAIWKRDLASNGIACCRQPSCTYKCSSYESILEHFFKCNFIPHESFLCKLCTFTANSKNKLKDHLKKVHASEDFEKDPDFDENDEESEEDEEDEENSSDENINEFSIKKKYCFDRSKTKYKKIAILDKDLTQNPQSTELFKPTLYWTFEFQLNNYELTLFNCLMPNNFTLLSNNDVAKYLPEMEISMAIKQVNDNSSKNTRYFDNDKWNRLHRFESDIYDAWLPIPSPMYIKNPTQYVAISTHPTMQSEYAVGKSYSQPNVIQIWNVGNLNHEINNINRPPVLSYAIAHNSGTVWCLEWCPSGCYQDVELDNYKAEENTLRRMGLLAAACSNGCVNIFSLPFEDGLKFEKTEYTSWPIYKSDPVMTLVVNHVMYEKKEQNWQCTKLSWTKEHGHNIIAAGFSNGYIALWNLRATSFLALQMRNNTRILSAFKHFFAHHNAVSMIALIPYGGSRYLASGSLDRTYKFWDLENTNVPQNCVKKGIIVDGKWMTNWPCAVLSFDDALGYKCTLSQVLPLREYRYKCCPILTANGPTYSITVNDYANSIAHGTLAGEIQSIFPHHLLHTDKLLPTKRQSISFIKIIDFSEQYQEKGDKENKGDKKNLRDYRYMPETYNECKNRFGIVFYNDFVDEKKENKNKRNENENLIINIEQYSFTSANKVAWNPNAWSYLWLIVGYQSGLVRLLNLKFMSNLHDLDCMLPSHVKDLLAKKGNLSQ
ncbi:general transcription factor 3C polypeptide 2-like isoform X2 [Pseudomyrmex gracilis]|uniref:general transcription factor 3C polypeptide 2-like isoform X2 n=1 Tax=Pseudomyrmex gracilis TaxID=219809 RepID=UPI000995ABC4|nr:general transcription factor 3C polypeptide 2-like isoform X2 [Pseudomyrmex gracilis]